MAGHGPGEYVAAGLKKEEGVAIRLRLFSYQISRSFEIDMLGACGPDRSKHQAFLTLKTFFHPTLVFPYQRRPSPDFSLPNRVSLTHRTFSAPHGCSRPTLLTCLPGNPNAAYMPSGQFARWKLGCSFNCYAECYVFACPACHSRYILFVWKQLKINRESITLSRL